MRKILISLILLLLFLGCGHNYVQRNIDISLLFINTLDEEILVRNKNGDVGFIGFFLLPDSQYLWEWDEVTETIEEKDTVQFQTTFEFFKEGNKHNFNEKIGSYLFEAKVYDKCQCIDTCYIE